MEYKLMGHESSDVFFFDMADEIHKEMKLLKSFTKTKIMKIDKNMDCIFFS